MEEGDVLIVVHVVASWIILDDRLTGVVHHPVNRGDVSAGHPGKKQTDTTAASAAFAQKQGFKKKDKSRNKTL